jgi:hypothetical protein
VADRYVATTGNDTTGDGSSGNPYATPGKAMSVAGAGDTIYVKAGTYTLTTATINVAGGPVKVTFTDEANITRIVGYDTNAAIDNTDAARPTLDAGATGSVVLFECSGYGAEFRNLIADGNAQTTVTGFYNSGGYASPFINCKAIDCTAYGFRGTTTIVGTALWCEATGCSGTGAFFNLACYACYAHDGTCPGFVYASGSQVYPCERCIADTLTGGSTDGFVAGSGVGTMVQFVHCVAYNCGRDGFRFDDYSRNSAAVNCIATGNAAYGFTTSATGGKANLTVATQSMGFVALSADPFTNAGAGDFSLNTTAGGGADCRGDGYPGAFPGGLSTGYPDIGAVQHADPAAAGSFGVIGAGGLIG